MKKYQVFGALTKEESERERNHKALAREIAGEGIVLLENNGVLPLRKKNIALYGTGAEMTVKGGTGSGEVHERHSVTVREGLENAGFTFPTTLWLDRFQKNYRDEIEKWHAFIDEGTKKFSPIRTRDMFLWIGENPMPVPQCKPVEDDELTADTDTAVYVVSRQAGEGHDRKVEKGDYLLSDVEEKNIIKLSSHYKNLILVINSGSIIDLSVLDKTNIGAAVLIGQCGMEGGNALADILTGKVCPSGRLTDTWAFHYNDYPCADTYSYRNGNLENEEYSEGIYVGYRWFDKEGIKPRYPFGYGLSYTSFEHTVTDISGRAVTVRIRNTGDVPGKETVMLFIEKPNSEIDCENKVLAAFVKTDILESGAEQTLTLEYDDYSLSVFDEETSAFIIKPGTYSFKLNGEKCGKISISEERIVEKVNRYESKDLKQSFSPKVEKLLKDLSDTDKIRIVTGGGYPMKSYNNVLGACGNTCASLLNKGIPNIVLADGPAGINVNQAVTIMKSGMPRYPDGLPDNWKYGWVKKIEPLVRVKPGKGRPAYRFMTAWPSETVLAQTWNTDLAEKAGKATGVEMLESGVSQWLAPAMNIHRNPLCGRNFEYYSEDPLISGKFAAAVVRGVQSNEGVGATVKHFCCNNQEDNRMFVSENVSERALREIYLRGFRIAVKEGRPWAVMSSYNRLNGKYVCNSYHLLTEILRLEWKFDGLVMSDWDATNQASHPEAVNAGNDLIMPGNKAVFKSLTQALKDGKLDKQALNISAGRVLELIFRCYACKEFR